MNSTQKDQAERVSRNAHISYIAANQILSAERQKEYRKLAIHIEHYIMDSQQHEVLKSLGLTIFDCIVGDYEWYDREAVERVVTEWNEKLGEEVIKLYVDTGV